MSKALEAARALVKMLEEQENGQSGIQEVVNPARVKLGELNRGDKFDTELGRFIVLDQTCSDPEYGETLVIMEDFIEKNVQFDKDSCDYTKSALREKFDGEITEKFEAVFGDNLVEQEVTLVSVNMQNYGKFSCKVRPITFDEAKMYNHKIINLKLDDWWWTCTSWSTAKKSWRYSVLVVYPSGNIYGYGCNGSGGVRPVCILKSNLVVSKVEE